MSTPRLTLRHLNRATLARQLLLARKKTPLPKAVEQLVGVQAQVPKPPFVGLWSRVEGTTRDRIAGLLRDRTLVRATTMRGTLHVMTASDYIALRSSLQDGLNRGMHGILGKRLAGIDVGRIVDLAEKYFATPRTFDEARTHLQAMFPALDERAMGYAVRLTLPLVQVPTNAVWVYPAQASFISARQWLGKPTAASAGPDALVLRYLAAYGPASVVDAQAWLGMQSLKPVVERLRPQLISLPGPGRAELFDLPRAPRPDPDEPAPVRFLPEWDNMLIGRADERFVATTHRKAVFLPGLRVAATFLVDGVVAGTWKAERVKATATLTLTPFAKLAKPVRGELEEEGEALLAFLEPDATATEVQFH